MKTAIVVLSDPSGGEEALGRVFNALAAAYDFRQRGHAVEVLFQGTGTRWVSALQKAGRVVRQDGGRWAVVADDGMRQAAE